MQKKGASPGPQHAAHLQPRGSSGCLLEKRLFRGCAALSGILSVTEMLDGGSL